MRMVKMKPKPMDLETAMQKFLLVKESQHTGEETMKDYRNCLARFLADSHNLSLIHISEPTRPY